MLTQIMMQIFFWKDKFKNGNSVLYISTIAINF